MINRKIEYYIETIFELISEWKQGNKDDESTAKLLRQMANHSKSISDEITKQGDKI